MLELAPGLRYFPGCFDRRAAIALLADIERVLAEAPPFHPVMPRTGKPFSVRMTNCGPLGWVSDRDGYRYQPTHPTTGQPWPAIPSALHALWATISNCRFPPEACLINLYDPAARMALHQDRDEADFDAPVLSLSLGATALFRYGGTARNDPTRSIRLASGDVLAMGGASRLCFHGIDRIYPGTSTLVANDGRINLTLRRVSAPV